MKDPLFSTFWSAAISGSRGDNQKDRWLLVGAGPPASRSGRVAKRFLRSVASSLVHPWPQEEKISPSGEPAPEVPWDPYSLVSH